MRSFCEIFLGLSNKLVKPFVNGVLSGFLKPVRRNQGVFLVEMLRSYCFVVKPEDACATRPPEKTAKPDSIHPIPDAAVVRRVRRQAIGARAAPACGDGEQTAGARGGGLGGIHRAFAIPGDGERRGEDQRVYRRGSVQGGGAGAQGGRAVRHRRPAVQGGPGQQAGDRGEGRGAGGPDEDATGALAKAAPDPRGGPAGFRHEPRPIRSRRWRSWRRTRRRRRPPS